MSSYFLLKPVIRNYEATKFLNTNSNTVTFHAEKFNSLQKVKNLRETQYTVFKLKSNSKTKSETSKHFFVNSGTFKAPSFSFQI